MRRLSRAGLWAAAACFLLATHVNANDDCSNATPIGVGSLSDTTVGATADGSVTCGNGTNSASRWYSYFAVADRLVTVQLCGSNYDTVLSVHSACPGTVINQIACNDDSCGLQSIVQFLASAGNDYLIRVAGYNGNTGNYTLDLTEVDPGTLSGPDVIYSECTSITHYGPVGTIHAYSLGSNTCNIGDQNLQWGATTPLLAMNAYRLHQGRIEHIGQSWVKNGTGAAASSGCGLPCNGSGGSVLGAGCLDVYGATFNGGQGILGPRSSVNAFTGAYPGQSGAAGSVIAERLQIDQSDLVQTGAQYFVEGVYVAPDDASFGNALNNASYKAVSVNPANFQMTPVGAMNQTIPAIYAWQAHGLGPNTPDPSVDIQIADVPNEGRFFVGSKAVDVGGGAWRYEYAIFNLNSDRSASSFTVPFPVGTAISGVGFRDVSYHSGEPYDNTDWSSSVGAQSITWSSPQTFAQNPNTNALRWGTMYSFWFEANVAPSSASSSLELFRPGTPSTLTITVHGPTPNAAPTLVRGDCNGDSLFDLSDAVFELGYLFPVGAPPVLSCEDACDANDDGVIDLSDPIRLLDRLFAGGAPLPAPGPACGADPSADALGCMMNGSCP